MSVIKSLKSFFNLIASKKIEYDKKLDIYTNGADNLYAEEAEKLIGASITATMASRLMVQYLVGKGFGSTADLMQVNNLKNTLITEARKVARSLTKHRGVYIQFEYSLAPNPDGEELVDIVPSGFKVLPFVRCRLGKKDSQEYNGKILVCKDWSNAKKEHITPIDVYNPLPAVVKAQVEACEGGDIVQKLRNYKGQILFINLDDEYYYPLSRIDAVKEECDSEAQAATFRNRSLRRGFFGKKLFVTRPLVDNDLIESARGVENPAPMDVRRLQEAESEREDFHKNLEGFVGVDNTGGVMHVELEYSGEKLEDAVLVKDIDSNINDKLFEYTEQASCDKILMAFNNLPKILLTSRDSSVFGNSGELLREAKRSYWEACTEDRATLVETLEYCLSVTGLAESLTLIPLLKEETNPDTAAEENRKAQAQLRGSVGGVTALIQVQQSVAAGTTTIDSAVAMVREIFGFTDEQAREIIGNPTKTDPTIR